MVKQQKRENCEFSGVHKSKLYEQLKISELNQKITRGDFFG
jgi:hypothetical protein|tara:strand:+ start:143 stop:265 length:123 start_codon:yes stop_codon:yes gene_type:complete